MAMNDADQSFCLRIFAPSGPNPMPVSPRYSRLLLCSLLLLLLSAPGWAVTLDQMKSGKTYRVERIVFKGNHAISSSDLLSQLTTKKRPFYMLWQKRPVFDPDVFAQDLKRLVLVYHAHGYFSAKVTYDLKVEGDLVTPEIKIAENHPTRIQHVRVLVDSRRLPTKDSLYAKLKLKHGQVFDGAVYEADQDTVRNFYRNEGYAHVTVRRQAEVNTSEDAVRIWYLVDTGSKGVFGPTTVTGNKQVATYIITRELAYSPGEHFSQKKLDVTQERLLKLGLFSVINLHPELDTRNPRVVPIRLTVRERPRHSIDIGGGYNTQSQFIGDLAWHDMNWQGGGRQLVATLRYSNIDSYARLTLTQPYLFNRRSINGILSLGEDIQQVPPYTLFGTRFQPSIQYSFSEKTKAFIGYRLEYDSLTSVDPELVDVLGGVKMNGIVSGPEAGFVMDTTNNLFNPSQGFVIELQGMQAGEIFGGNYDFYRFWGQIKHYHLLGWQTILAMRLKLGTGDYFGSPQNYPLFYRFFIGGEGSVRGWRYWMLGPSTPDNTPIGGLTDMEGSLELRHPIWQKLSGAVFLDFGQLSTHAYDVPITDLDFSAGPALSYNTPVGPIRIDLGIPFEKPRDQTQWQVYFSIGQYF
jgi:outer membrane protein assembly complex protein YaeT